MRISNSRFDALRHFRGVDNFMSDLYQVVQNLHIYVLYHSCFRRNVMRRVVLVSIDRSFMEGSVADLDQISALDY